MSHYKKADIQFHRDGYGPSRPAVNVRVRGDFDRALAKFRADNPEVPARFTREWIDANCKPDEFWGMACQDGFDSAEEMATEIFGKSVDVYSEGRSGGWLIVEGLPAVETWDAILISKWGRFERFCKAAASDVPYQTADLIYYNVFLPAEDAQETIVREADITA